MKLLTELKERSILQVSLVYVAVAWVLVQVADTLFETFEAPEWVMKVLILLLMVGFPVAVILAWAQGLRKQDAASSEPPVKAETPDDNAGTTTSEKDVIVRPLNSKSIAVLAFEDMSPDRDHEYFSDGMSEEILNMLARIPDLVVIGRTSSFSFKGKNIGIPEIGAALNVAHVLEGSVRKSGNKVRITVQLIKVDGDFHVWSESFDRELEDVFQVQDEIALAVTRKLESTLLPGKEPVQRQIPENMEAYELTLKGLHFTNRGLDGIESSLDYFERALAMEPGYSRAHEGISRYYLMAAIWGFVPPLEAIPKIHSHCLSAIESDPGSAVSYARLASSAMVLEWDWEAARHNLKEAMALGPNDAYVKFVLSQWYLMCNNETEAVTNIEQSIALDPLNLFQLWMAGSIHLSFGREDPAEVRLKQVLELDPNFSDAIRLMAEISLVRGESDQALELAEQAYTLQKGSTAATYTLALVHLGLGNEAEVRRLLQIQIDKDEREFVLAMVTANIYAWLGELDNAYEWLEKAYEQHDQAFRLLKVGSGWDAFKADPRFARYVERLSIPDGELE
jgi:adenylate cyclase